MATFIGYYRVSTQAQGRSGLGLEAQRDAVAKYVKSVGGTLLAEFQEVESGGRSDRVELKAALQHCRMKKAMLVIAKIDRLARNVHFISQLLESGVEFIAADMPSANKLTIHIIAAMAEYERDVVSQRTKASLAAAKSRGVTLGNPRAAEVSAFGVASARAKADSYALALKPTLDSLRASGITSFSRIATALEASRIRTRRGGQWTATGVKNILLRLEEISRRVDSTK